MLITPSFKKSLIVEQFQGNYLKVHVNQIIITCNLFKTATWTTSPKFILFAQIWEGQEERGEVYTQDDLVEETD